MKTKQEILDYLNWRKEYYQNNILRYNEILAHLNFNSNDYIMYDLLRKMDKKDLNVINEILDFINEKEDK